MAKILEIVINKADTFRDVRRNSAYVGKKASLDGAEFEKLVIVEEDEPVLQEAWRVACGEVDKMFAEYAIESNHGDGDEYEVTCRMPDNWTENLEGDLRMECAKYITHSILAAWCNITKPENVKQEAEYISAAAANTRSSIYARKRPKRHTYHHHDCGL